MADESFLDLLPSHPIFTTPGPASSSSDSSSSQGRTLVVVRNADLIVWTKGELRMTGLVDCKSNKKLGYKVLVSPHLKPNSPAPTQLLLSPSSKLLLLRSPHSLTIVALPRSSATGTHSNLGASMSLGSSFSASSSTAASTSASAPTIACQSFPLGTFQHSSTTSPITSALWHPHSHSSLLVLTLSGQLYEYAPLKDAEPVQTIALFPPRKGGRFEAFDERERECVSLAIGEGEGDWGKMTVYVGTRDGGVRCLCPYLPANAEYSYSYLLSLQKFTSSKLAYATSSTTTSTPSSSTSLIPPPVDQSAINRYRSQQAFIDSLVSQVEGQMDVDDPLTLSGEGGLVSIRGGSKVLSGRKVVLQGPLGMVPNPTYEEEGEEELVEMSLVGSVSVLDEDEDEQGGKAESKRTEFNTLVTLSSKGTVSVFLELEKPEAVFAMSTSSGLFAPLSVSGRRLIASTSSAPATQQEEEYAAPTLRLYETSQLPASTTSTIVKDPIYPDTVYLLSGGLYSLSLGWMMSLSKALSQSDDQPSALEEFLAKDLGGRLETLVEESDKVESATVVQDVYLGYGVVAGLLKGGIGIPLDLRVDPLPTTIENDLPLASTSKLPLAIELPPGEGYNSLLSAPFSIPSILTRPRSPLPPVDKSPLKEITPASLRQLGKAALSIREDIHDVSQAGKDVRSHVELLQREVARQTDVLDTITINAGGKTKALRELEERLEKIKATQAGLVRKADRTLQKAMDGSSLVVSEKERQWFVELAKLGEEVGKSGGLKDRVTTIEDQLAILLPTLAPPPTPTKGLSYSAAVVPPPVKNPVLGKHQLARLEDSLSAEAKLLSTATRKLDDLTVRLGSVKI